MKKAELIDKIKEIKRILDAKFDCEAEDDGDWAYEHESTMRSIEYIIDEILKNESN